MKRVLKKITGMIVAAAVAVSALSVARVDAKAATAINVNQEYRFRLGYEQVAQYTFTTPSDAVTSVSACIVGGSAYAHAYFKLTVDYCNYDGGFINSGKGATETNEFVFAPGKTATITFDSVTYKDTVDIAFTVKCTNPGKLEKESNNSVSSATKIQLKKTYNGVVSYVDSDVDWYEFKAPKTGKYKFYAVNAQTNGYTHVYVEGYKSITKKDSNFATFLNSGKGWVSSKKIKLKKGKKYYIKFSSATYNDSVPVQLKVKKVK